jgi:hypothetical protein
MLSRAWYLLESSLPRESRRMDATVIRVIYLIVAMIVLLTVMQSPFVTKGTPLLSGLTVIHLAMAAVLGVRLSGDVAGDRSSGVVGLLALAGLKGQDVAAARLITVAFSFLSVWSVRIPMLMLAFTLGGIRLRQILMLEILLLGIFVLVVGVGLLIAHYASDRAAARGVFVLPGLLDLALYTPKIVVTILGNFQIWTVPNFIYEPVEWLSWGSCLAGLSGVLRFSTPSWAYLIPAVLHIVIGALSLYCWRRVYFTCLDEAGDAAAPTADAGSVTAVKKSESTNRPSRPCWDDAFAWQAYQIHSNGRTGMITRVSIGGFILVGAGLMATLGPPYPEMAMVIVMVTSIVLMFIGQGKVSDCLQRELREKTLGTLLMTPHTPREICDGWGRGAWRMMLVDLPVHLVAVVGVVCWSLFYSAPGMFASVIVCGYMGLLSMRSFLILSPLVPFSFRGIATGVGLIFLALVLFVIAVRLSLVIHSALGPLVLAPMAYGWNRVCRWMIPSWFQKKQEALE